MKTIKIDDDIYEILKFNSEPFVDQTPNDVLRKLLLNRKSNSSQLFYNPVEKDLKLYDLPYGTPNALSQVLNMIYLIKKYNYDRLKAVKLLSSRFSISPTTIIDKFTRQLNLISSKFDYLLQHNPKTLQTILLNRFVNHKDIINNFFDTVIFVNNQFNKVYQNLSKEYNDYSLSRLKGKRSELFNNTKPNYITINKTKIKVKDWTDLSIKFIQWLIDNNKINIINLPIEVPNSRSGKYFINNRPQHSKHNLDGKWNKVGDFYVDTKYNAGRIVLNLCSMLEQLSLKDLKVHVGVKLNDLV